MTEMSNADEIWMKRCFDLARRGQGFVSPNPPVGAVLVYDGGLLSEGYHKQFGGLHAEVEAIRNVPDVLRHLIPYSTLYVSLEPCCITGKTPPCTDLIVREHIKDVRISTLDPNPQVAGQGLSYLEQMGIHTRSGILEDEGKLWIRAFRTNMLQQRPHILLKWAQSLFGYAGMEGKQVWLSDPLTRTWSHQQRAFSDAILVGARTVETDDPALTVRDYPGRSPKRVVYDPNGRLSMGFKVFADDVDVFYFSKVSNPKISGSHIHLMHLPEQEEWSFILRELYRNQLGILLVEGGPYVHKTLIKAGLWDEAWVIQSSASLAEGIQAPNVTGRKIETFKSGEDRVVGIRKENESY